MQVKSPRDLKFMPLLKHTDQESNDTNDLTDPIDGRENGWVRIYLVDHAADEGDAPIIRFGRDGSYLYADPRGLKALERFLSAYAGNEIEIVDTISKPFDSDASLSLFEATSLEAAVEAKERARDRVRNRLAAEHFMRYHQQYGYSKEETKREREEIHKFLTENGISSSDANENLDLLESFYRLDQIKISSAKETEK